MYYTGFPIKFSVLLIVFSLFTGMKTLAPILFSIEKRTN